MVKNFFFVVPKSYVSLIILLLIVAIIAFFVNRHRDTKGKVSFIDKTKKGIMGIRLYQLDNGNKKSNWLLPLWVPENNLILDVKIMLTKGEYEAEAYWEENNRQPMEELFNPQPVDKEEADSLSEVSRFGLSRQIAVEFKLSLSGNKLKIDSPDTDSLEIPSAQIPFPLTISDPSLKKIAARFKKAKANGIWELPIIDGHIMTSLMSETKIIKHKLDGIMAKNKELESNLDHAVKQQLRLKDEAEKLKEKSGGTET